MFSKSIRILVTRSLSYRLGSYYTRDLHNAVENQDLEKIASLIDDGIYVDMTAYSTILGEFSCGPLYVTALHLAAKEGFISAVELLLKKGANPNCVTDPMNSDDSKFHWNALHFALCFEHYDLATLLIDTYDMVIDDVALHIVKKYGKTNALPLLQKHMDLNANFINTVTETHHQITVLNWYKEQMQEPKQSYYYDSKKELAQIFYSSVKNKRTELVKELLQRHHYSLEEINTPKHDIENSLISPRILNQFPKLCEKLESNWHDYAGNWSHYESCANTRKVPILFVAILTDNPDMVELLINHGAATDITVNGVSALDLIKTVLDLETSLLETPNAVKIC